MNHAGDVTFPPISQPCPQRWANKSVGYASRTIGLNRRGFYALSVRGAYPTNYVIPDQVPPVLERLAIGPAGYLRHVTGQSGSVRSLALGAADKLQAYARQLGQKFIRGQRQGRGLYGEVVVSA